MNASTKRQVSRRDLMTMIGLAAGAVFLPGQPAAAAHSTVVREYRVSLGNEGAMPDLNGAISWLNSDQLSRELLRGKVVFINFWTYTCINSLRPLPYLKAWAERYKSVGLTLIGIHTPEFSFESEPANVQWAVRNFDLDFPVAIDSNRKIWSAFNNEYWPAQYLVDAKGQIRYHHFGEGDYDEIEHTIQRLLKENGATELTSELSTVSGVGIEAAPDWVDAQSFETYVGYRQAKNFASPEGLHKDSPRALSVPAKLALNYWGLGGLWSINPEAAILQSSPGTVVYRFHSRDLNLVLAPAKNGSPIRFKATLDDLAPSDNHGTDTDSDGAGIVREARLFQLIRQRTAIQDRTLKIEFLDPGVQVLDFTFG